VAAQADHLQLLNHLPLLLNATLIDALDDHYLLAAN
jgi:hypothetical protein